MRIGNGFDAHSFVEGRPLVLGGVQVPHTRGLDGHSDADVLLHAVCDALLGALALGDIGQHFPPTDEKYRGISSLHLVLEVFKLVKMRGYRVGNLDCTVIAQEPKLALYINEMRVNIAGVLEAPLDRVSVKATTTEGMGFTGRKEGIAAMAVALLEEGGSAKPRAKKAKAAVAKAARKKPAAKKKAPKTVKKAAKKKKVAAKARR